jgi:transcription elongation factor GreA
MQCITKKHFDKLHLELEDLVRQKTATSKRIGDAAAFGDLSENAEFDYAREEMRRIGKRIFDINEILSQSQIITKSATNDGTARLGSSVLCREDGEEYTITLATEDEIDGTGTMVTVSSPIGSALLGKTAGDTVTVKAPMGSFEIKILSVS